MRPAEQARQIATDIQRWIRATPLSLERLARWTNVMDTLRRLADDYETARRRYEAAAYDLEQERKCRRALEHEVENLKQHIIRL